MSTTAFPKIRSVLLECQTWRDTYGNPYTSARLWINGGFIGTFAYRYGQPEDLIWYDLEPYLERVGIFEPRPAGEYAGHARGRLRALGVDFYSTESKGRYRDLIREDNLEDAETLAETLTRRESHYLTEAATR